MNCWNDGMSTSTSTETRNVLAASVTVADDTLTVDLTDGRTIAVPLTWYPRLLHGTPEERSRWRLIGQGQGIHWGDLDEDISVSNLLDGNPSGESQKSLRAWQNRRSGIPQRLEDKGNVPPSSSEAEYSS